MTRRKWVGYDGTRLLGVQRAGAMILPAHRSPFIDQERGQQPLIAAFVGGIVSEDGVEASVELAGSPQLMGALAGHLRGAAESLGPAAAAEFTAAFDQAVAFQQDT